MFKNYLKTTFRNMMKHRGATLINIAGLAVGFAVVILVFLNVRFQFSFDSFHENLERIHYVKLGEYNVTVPAVADLIKENVAEVREVVRFENWEGRKVVLSYKNKHLTVKNIIFSDPSVFDVFSFTILEGDAETALNNPNSLVLSQSQADKLFADENPVGKTVAFNNQEDYTITAVVEDPPANASHVYGGFVPFENREEMTADWDGMYYDTYVLLAKHQSPATVEKKVKQVVANRLIELGAPGEAERYPANFLPMEDVYFNQEMADDGYRHSNRQTAYLFAAVGIFLLCLAVLNYINLTTARSFDRMKEIAIRKAVGSEKRHLVMQFLSESVIISMLAAGVGVVLATASLPFVNRFASSAMDFSPVEEPALLLIIMGVSLFVGVCAGLIPSFYLASLSAVHTFKGKIKSGNRGLNIRRILIIFQFSISIILLISTFLIISQRNYIRTMDTGFKKDRIIWFDLQKEMLGQKELFRKKLLESPYISHASYTKFTEADAANGWQDEYNGNEVNIRPYWVDAHYIDMMGLTVINGRTFSEKSTADRDQTIILNKRAVQKFGMESPLGKTIFGKRIIGVVEDFNFRSLHHPIEPLGLIYMSGADKVNIKVTAGNMSRPLEHIEKTWHNLFPGYPFEYHFLDESYSRLYESERKTSTLFNFFSFTAILIACLGLYGLTTFSTRQRTREIGIRKVLGARITGIVLLLSKDFLKWVVLANLIAWPAAWYAMDRWLQNFAYRADMAVWPFFSAAVITLIIALMTVSFQAVRAARANPVESLRYE